MPSRAILRAAVCAALCALLPAFAEPPLATLPRLQATQMSVSGLSSGGYMAVQFSVAYAADVVGTGVIAGGPYFCARRDLDLAINVCSCTGWFQCRVAPGATHPDMLAQLTRRYAAEGKIDPVAALARHKVWLFSGLADSLVPQAVVSDLERYYRHFTPAARIRYKKNLHAEHAMPTDSFGNACATLATPYISNCGYDAAGELLQWIYGPLAARSDKPAAGRLLRFSQAEFLAAPTTHGMADSGLLYIPPGCEGDASGCRLHIALHGCLQDLDNIGEDFVRHAGYNRWADTNRLLILYPQASAVYPLANPKACWDWWGYDDSRYALKAGRQMRAIKHMAERLLQSAN